MNVYTMIHVRRTPVRRTCTAYMYHSVNTLLVWTVHSNVQKDDRRQEVRTDLQSDGQQGVTGVDTTQRQPGTQHTTGII